LAPQFKPFVYLNWLPDRLCAGFTKEKSRLPAGPSLLSSQSELAILIGVLTRIGLLALTAWILLLLAGLLPAALLTRLLARVLVLLTRVLILSAHSGISLVALAGDNRVGELWLRGNIRSNAIIPWQPSGARVAGGTGYKTTSVQYPHAAATDVAAPRFHC
jgi:hypothetical protein